MNDQNESNRSAIHHLIDTIKKSNGQTENVRLKFILEKFIDHFYSFAEETQLQNDEWFILLDFLKKCGQNSTSISQELFLLSDILGLSSMIDTLNHPKVDGATQSTVVGPFHTDDAPHVSDGESIASEGRGEPCLVLGSVKNTDGKPIEGIEIDVWQADGNGLYDNQYEIRDKPDMRAILTSDVNGNFSFRSVRPFFYPVPTDGPVGVLLRELKREAFRPAHVHFYIKDPKGIYENLITSLYIRGDPYESKDAVFGVKPELIVDLERISDVQVAKKYHLDEKDWLIRYEFVLMTVEQTAALRSSSH